MSEENPNRERIIFVLLLFLALAARVIKINQGFWYDELYSLLNFIHAPLYEMLTSMTKPNNHVLANLLAKLSIGIFGEAEWSARLPSLILGSLTVPVLYVFSRKFFPIRVSLLASLLLCFSKWHIWHSQEARGYAGMIFCVLVSQMLFLDLIEKFQKRRAWLYFLASLAAIYFHLYAAFVIASHGIVFFAFRLWRKDEVGWRPLYVMIAVAAAALILYAPMLGSIFGLLHEGTGALYGKKLSSGFFSSWICEWGAGDLPLFLSLIMLGLFLAGFVENSIKRPAQSAVLILPVIFILLGTWIMGFYIYLRFFALFLPFYFVFISNGIWLVSRSRGIPSFAVASALIIVIMLPGLSEYYRSGMQGFRKAGQWIETHRSDTPVHSMGLSAEEFRYYFPEAIPVPLGKDLDSFHTEDSLVVASHPWSWGNSNTEYLKNECSVSKEWPSGGYEENIVIIFDCGATEKR